MKKLLLLLFIALFTLNVDAQFCGQSGQTTTIDTQTELDNIMGCTDFYGNLFIIDQTTSNTFTNINLPNLQTVEGNLLIQYPNTNISFSNLNQIGGDLSIIGYSYCCNAQNYQGGANVDSLDFSSLQIPRLFSL